MRVDSGGAARAAASGVGARARVDGRMPEVMGDTGKLGWVEWFFASKSFGRNELGALPAKEADAMLTLEKEWREARDDNQRS